MWPKTASLETGHGELTQQGGPEDLAHMMSTSDPAQAMLHTDVRIY